MVKKKEAEWRLLTAVTMVNSSCYGYGNVVLPRK